MLESSRPRLCWRWWRTRPPVHYMIGYSAEGGFGPTTGADIPPDDPGLGAGVAVEPNARGTGAGAPDCRGSGAGARGSPDAASPGGAGVAAGAVRGAPPPRTVPPVR